MALLNANRGIQIERRFHFMLSQNNTVEQGSPTFFGPRATFWMLMMAGAHLSQSAQNSRRLVTLLRIRRRCHYLVCCSCLPEIEVFFKKKKVLFCLHQSCFAVNSTESKCPVQTNGPDLLKSRTCQRRSCTIDF